MMIGQRFTVWSVLADIFGNSLRAELARVRPIAPRQLFTARYPLLKGPGGGVAEFATTEAARIRSSYAAPTRP
jgi:hypothetical protein